MNYFEVAWNFGCWIGYIDRSFDILDEAICFAIEQSKKFDDVRVCEMDYTQGYQRRLSLDPMVIEDLEAKYGNLAKIRF